MQDYGFAHFSGQSTFPNLTQRPGFESPPFVNLTRACSGRSPSRRAEPTRLNLRRHDQRVHPRGQNRAYGSDHQGGSGVYGWDLLPFPAGFTSLDPGLICILSFLRTLCGTRCSIPHRSLRVRASPSRGRAERVCSSSMGSPGRWTRRSSLTSRCVFLESPTHTHVHVLVHVLVQSHSHTPTLRLHSVLGRHDPIPVRTLEKCISDKHVDTAHR